MIGEEYGFVQENIYVSSLEQGLKKGMGTGISITVLSSQTSQIFLNSIKTKGHEVADATSQRS